MAKGKGNKAPGNSFAVTGPNRVARCYLGRTHSWVARAHALAALASNFDGTGIEVSFEAHGEERELPEAAELVLYRAMQEGLTNAAKRARPRRVRAKLTFSQDAVRLEVARL